MARSSGEGSARRGRCERFRGRGDSHLEPHVTGERTLADTARVRAESHASCPSGMPIGAPGYSSIEEAFRASAIRASADTSPTSACSRSGDAHVMTEGAPVPVPRSRPRMGARSTPSLLGTT